MFKKVFLWLPVLVLTLWGSAAQAQVEQPPLTEADLLAFNVVWQATLDHENDPPQAYLDAVKAAEESTGLARERLDHIMLKIPFAYALAVNNFTEDPFKDQPDNRLMLTADEKDLIRRYQKDLAVLLAAPVDPTDQDDENIKASN